MASFRKKRYRSKNARKSRIKRLGKKSLIGGMMDEVFTKEQMVATANKAVKVVMTSMLEKANEEEMAAATEGARAAVRAVAMEAAKVVVRVAETEAEAETEAVTVAAVEAKTSFTRTEVVDMIQTAVMQAVDAVEAAATKAVKALPSSQWTGGKAVIVRVMVAAEAAYIAATADVERLTTKATVEGVVDANNVAGGRRRYTRRWRRGRRM
jgi:hypothetical protein